jgi:uncharacterized LabA/DUF88 family protein
MGQTRRPAEEVQNVSSMSGGVRGPERITYAFIDGGYVREVLDRAMKEVFGIPGDLAPEKIAPADVTRAYFYDCIDELRKDSETEAEFQARREELNKRISRMRSRPGFHFRPGTLSRGRRQTQKEVDVLLAVDMLTHGFNRNMTHAVLVTGDLDFRPVVEALVRTGVFVNVWYEKRTAADALPLAADFGSELNWHALYDWNSQSFMEEHRKPIETSAHGPVTGALVRSGSYEGRAVQMLKPLSPAPFVLRVERYYGVQWLEHEDEHVLDRYFSVINGPIEWK